MAKNYVAYARTLLASFMVFEPDIRRFVFVIDDLDGSERIPEGDAIAPTDVFDYEHFVNLAFSYDITEFATAVKPFVLRHLLGRGFDRVLYFDPDIELFGSLDPVIDPLERNDICLTPHTTEPIPFDGKQPDEIVLLRAGAYNLGFVGVSNTSQMVAMLDWWAQRLEQYCLSDVERGLFVDQKWIDLIPGLMDRVAIVRHRGCNVAYWNLHSRRIDDANPTRLIDGTPLVFFHYSGFDVRIPSELSKYQTRISVSDEPGLSRLLQNYARRIGEFGHAARLQVPYGFRAFSNGVRVDAFARKVMRDAAAAGIRFPDPFDIHTEPSAWAYINEPVASERSARRPLTRYLIAVSEVRSDLRVHFPDVRGNDRERYVSWLRNEAATGVEPAYLQAAWKPPKPRAVGNIGVNVAGYFRTESGVGEAGRAQVAALGAAAIPSNLVDFSAHAPSRSDDASIASRKAGESYPINLVCVNADQVSHFRTISGERFFRNKYNIGSWWWELPEFPDRWLNAFDSFDEIWVGTQFVATAVAGKSPVPVVLVPPVVNVGAAHPVPRSTFGLAEDETTFLFLFDFYSVFERKNPLGAIDAFRRAFPGGERVRLVLKWINGEHDPAGVERVRVAIGQDRRISVIDRYMSREEKNCLIATCDAYVSLHRSEGFGYTLAEAMALGKPVIATDWSGNADYMTPANSYPIGFRLVALGQDYGPYASEQQWADPDLDEAARAMRDVHERPAQGRRKGERGREEVSARYSASAVGRIVGRRLDLINARLPSKRRRFGRG